MNNSTFQCTELGQTSETVQTTFVLDAHDEGLVEGKKDQQFDCEKLCKGPVATQVFLSETIEEYQTIKCNAVWRCLTSEESKKKSLAQT